MSGDKLTFNMLVRTPGGIGLVKERVIRDGQEIGVMVGHSVEIPANLPVEVRRKMSPCIFRIYKLEELEAIHE